MRGAAAGLAVAVLGLAGCGEASGDDTASAPARELYASSVAEAGSADGPPIEAWRAAGRRALYRAEEVSTPYRERGRIAADEPDAVGYRFHLREGQVLEAVVRTEDPEAAGRYFVELHRVADDDSTATALIAEADGSGAPLEHVSEVDADHVLRVQPELSVGGVYRVELVVRSAYGFPVEDRGPEAITSRFGAPRDGGRRAHRGLDAVAPRGTSAVAATRAIVHRVGTSPQGGNHVWLRDWDRRRDLYYAHLDEAWVNAGMVVERGQPIGAVGTTGNAASSGPHLHFGIYDFDGRASDPLPWVVDPEVLAGSSDTPR